MCTHQITNHVSVIWIPVLVDPVTICTVHMLKNSKIMTHKIKKHIYPGLDDCDVKNENGEYMKLGHSQFRIALLWSCHCYWKYPFWIVSVHIPLFHYYLNYKCSSGCSGGKGAFLISTSNCIDIKSVCKSIDFHEHSQCVDVLFCRYNYL